MGRAIVLAFADAGGNGVVSSRTLPELEVVAGGVKARGRVGLPMLANAGKIDDLKKLVGTVMSEFGRLTFL